MEQVPAWVLRKLTELPGLGSSVIQSEGKRISMQWGEGPQRVWRVVSLLSLSRLGLIDLFDSGHFRLAAPDSLTLYLTRPLDKRVRQLLADARCSWVEASEGAVHLDGAPYYVHVEGTLAALHDYAQSGADLSGGMERPARLVGRSGICAEVLLLWWAHLRKDVPALPALTQTTLAELSGTTTRLAARVLHRLEALGVLEAERRGKRTSAWSVFNAGRLLDTWVADEHKAPTATRAYVYARHTAELVRKLGAIGALGECWALGGTAAANAYAPTLTADPPPTIWISERARPADVVKAAGGEIVDSGANVVFWQSPKDPWVRFTNQSGTATRVAGELPTWAEALVYSAYWRPVAPFDSLPIVSPMRALQQAMVDETGRSEEVALALRRRLGITDAA
jgi:hypothetical protein